MFKVTVFRWKLVLSGIKRFHFKFTGATGFGEFLAH
jgi:hypothetical protein